MTEQQARVNKLIERVERHQKTLKLSDQRFVARYQEYLRSTDTWRRRLCERKWDEIGRNLDKHEQNLNRLVALLDGGQELGDYYESLPIAKYGQMAYDMLQGQNTDRRVVFVIGPTGVGKSWLLKSLARTNPTEAAYVYTNECWHESMTQISKGLATAIDAGVDANSCRTTFANVTQRLRAQPITLMIDDVQKAGVLGLKLIKSLVDDTRAKFILGVYPQAWNKLLHGSSDAMSEAQQILGRTIKPVMQEWKNGLRNQDVAAYMQAAKVGGDVKAIAQRIAPVIQANGNLRLLSDAVGLAASNAEEQDVDLDAALVEAAVWALCPKAER
jgi:energy-coupling factor transporter ATP-binding protein EcfA2